MTFIFLLAITFLGLLVLAYLEDPRTEQRHQLNRLVKESLKNERMRKRKNKRCYRYMRPDWPKHC